MTPKPYSRKISLAVVLAAIMLVSVVATPAAALYTGGDYDPDPNPDFPQQCGVNVLILIDNTGSLGDANLANAKNAANATVDVLRNTQFVSGVGIIKFSQETESDANGADTVVGITMLDSDADATSVKDAVGTIQLAPSEFQTNWEAAFLEASQTHNDGDGDALNENANKPADIVIILSDGRPNSYGYPFYNGSGNADSLEAATLAANEVKSEGTRIIGVGFPDRDGNLPPAASFEAVTDGASSIDDTESSDPQEIDYYLAASSSELPDVLTGIANEIDCGIAVEKTNDAGGDSTFSDVIDLNTGQEVTDEGSDVPFEVTFTNTGSIDLTLVDFEDDKYDAISLDCAPATFGGHLLGAGESLTCSFTETAPTTGDFPLTHVNNFTVYANDSVDNQLSDTDDTQYLVQDLLPELEIVKDVKEAGSADAFANSTTVAPGADVVYRVIVTNPADAFETVDLVDYEDVIGSDATMPDLYSDESLQTAIDLTTVSLAPGESVTVYFGGSAPEADADSLEDVFSVTGEDDDGNSLTVSDPALVETEQVPPELEIIKDVKGSDDVSFANSTTVAPGADVVYRVIVTNPADAFETVDLVDYEDVIGSDVTMPDLYSDESLQTAIDITSVSLAPGESVTVYFGGSAPEADADSLVDTFSVTGEDDDGQSVTVSDPALVATEQVPPELEIVKDVKEAGSADAFANSTTVAPGADVVYRVIVTNPADAFETVSLTDYEDVIGSDVTMPDLYSDESLQTAIDLTTVSLAPGESVTVYFGGSAPEADADSLEDVFSVTGEDDDGQSVTVSDPARVDTVAVPPELDVTKYVDANGDETFQDVTEAANNPSDDVVYMVVVANPADAFETVSLTGYEDVVDSVASEPSLYSDYGLSSPVDLTTVTLAPGESVTVYFGGMAPADYDASLTDTFRVYGEDDDGQTVSAQDDAEVTTPPGLDICPRTPGFWSTHNGDYAKGNNLDLTTEHFPITLGDGDGKGVVVDSDAVANAIFETELTADSSKSNGISKLYIHLLAAKLNTDNGAIAPQHVLDAIERSDEILTANDESDWKDIKKNDRDLAQEIEDLKDVLDAFNNRHYTGEGCTEDWWKEE